MITIAAVPKPFKGHFGVIQRNAIQSWAALRPIPQIILFGNEEGTAAVASEVGAEHVPNPARNEFGTPLLDDVIRTTRQRSVHDLLCYVNADIILLPEWTGALQALTRQMERFLVVARRLNVNVTAPIDFGGWNECRQRELVAAGRLGDSYSIDVFVFPKNTYLDVPPFAIGRPWFDHWFIKSARVRGLPVVDVSPLARAVHQNHDYSHVNGGQAGVLGGQEAQSNLVLFDTRAVRNARYRCIIEDATHKLTSGGIRRRWSYPLMPWKRAAMSLGYSLWWTLLDFTRPLRRRLGLRQGFLRRWSRVPEKRPD
jgi:hypothetical protein